MATVKAILDEFCDRINQQRESAYVAGTTPAARQYVGLFKFIAGQLLQEPNGWTQLKRLYLFTTQNGVALYGLPQDYYRSLAGTQWSVTNQIPIYGPLSDAQLAFQTYGVSVVGPYAGFQINGPPNFTYTTTPYTASAGGMMQLSPAGADNTSETIVAYISSNYVWPSTAWTAGLAYSVGEIVYGFGNLYICTDAITTATTMPSATTGTQTDGDGVWAVYYQQTTVSADTNLVLFPTELMVEGLRWAWYQSKRQDYLDIKEQWQSAIRTELGRLNGNGIVNAAGYGEMWDSAYPFAPDGSWNV